MLNAKTAEAKVLFNAGFEQKRIAQMLKLSEVTISKWAKEGEWKKKLTENKMRTEASAERVQKLIDYQLRALEELTEKWEKDRKPGETLPLIQAGNTDGLQKLYTTIKSKEIAWSQIVKIITEFVDNIQERDLALAKKLVPLADSYINNKRILS
ncbi:MAG: terminase gpP N-terminus-related DNA-binding protein [Shewanella sp.]